MIEWYANFTQNQAWALEKGTLIWQWLQIMLWKLQVEQEKRTLLLLCHSCHSLISRKFYRIICMAGNKQALFSLRDFACQLTLSLLSKHWSGFHFLEEGMDSQRWTLEAPLCNLKNPTFKLWWGIKSKETQLEES